jgi:carboxyl-terminal processing protease
MKTGNCDALSDLSKVAEKRAEESEEFVKKFVDKNYKLDESVELIVDPAKRTYAKTVEEKNKLLTKMIHFQISNYLLSKMKLDDAKKQLVHRYELITKRIKDKKMDNLLESFLEGFATALDPHSSYMTQNEMEDFQIQMQLSLEGIGAALSSQDGFTVIEELIPGGGAEKSKKLLPKDKIMAVKQEGQQPVAVMDKELREVVAMIRGKKGTKVTLTILRQAEKTESFDITIVRDKIDIKEQAAKITYEKRKQGDKELTIGILDLPSFYGGGGKGGRSSYSDMKKLLEEAVKKKVDGLVLNLSRNGGGLLDEAVKISGLFINKGAVVATKDTNGEVNVLEDEDTGVVYQGPLVVLVSRLSASASEILAGALKDYKRALIVGGDHTFGKGSVQVVSGLPFDLGGMKVTTGMFFVPGGASTQHQGVSSDIILPSYFSNEEIGEKNLDYSLAPQKIPAFLSKEANSTNAKWAWKSVESDKVKVLADKSKKRVEKSTKWAELIKSIEESNKNKGIVKLADLRKQADKEKKEEKKKGAKGKDDKGSSEVAEDEGSSKKAQAKLEALVEESINIAADLTEIQKGTPSVVSTSAGT